MKIFTLILLSFPILSYAALPKQVQIDQQQAFILQALKNKEAIDCAAIIKHTDKFESLTSSLPAALYYYRAACLSATFNDDDHIRAYSDLNTYFRVNQKKDKIYDKALVLYSSVEQEYNNVQNKKAEAARKAAEEEAQKQRNIARLKALEPLRLAAIDVHNALCDTNIYTKLKDTEDVHESVRFKTIGCNSGGGFDSYYHTWEYGSEYDDGDKKELVVNYQVMHGKSIDSIKSISVSNSCLTVFSQNDYDVKRGYSETIVNTRKDTHKIKGPNNNGVSNNISACDFSPAQLDETQGLIKAWNNFTSLRDDLNRRGIKYSDVLSDIKNPREFYFSDKYTPDTRAFYTERFD